MDKIWRSGVEVEVRKTGQKGTIKKVLRYTAEQNDFGCEVIMDNGKELVYHKDKLILL